RRKGSACAAISWRPARWSTCSGIWLTNWKGGPSMACWRSDGPGPGGGFPEVPGRSLAPETRRPGFRGRRRGGGFPGWMVLAGLLAALLVGLMGGGAGAGVEASPAGTAGGAMTASGPVPAGAAHPIRVSLALDWFPNASHAGLYA